ncbi:restriction endonuclease subunit S [Holdemania filiformis]|uniref:Type I restriction modification DNA specificity domain protein n=1 Tax=Holdemania filiformis DSM 12042 TaxID=545696 RepID=B9Y4K2_9FIRM|nr:restriction endonuclease subunit S [Holdemania filiformis]EEF69072.1 type I restriction modification DNA specificity domain protein [Holdemania filiformis DSM 12042]
MFNKFKLGDICEIVSGTTPNTSCSKYWNGDINWITPAELSDDTIIINESVRKITRQAVIDTGLKSFPPGTVILSSRAPIGKVAIAGREMYCNQGFKNLICSERINNIYLYWFLKRNTQYLNSLGRGATFKEISKSIVSDIQISLPLIEEQIKRAENLRKCWNVIILRKRELCKLDDLIKARFVEMFGNPITNNKNFVVKKVIEVVKLQRGHDLPIQNRIQNSTIPVWGSNGIVGYHNEAKSNSGIITGRSGTLGKVYYYAHPFWPLNTTLYSINTYNNNIIYLKYLLEFYELQRFASGTGVPTLNRNEFHNEMIIDVPLDLQNEFADFVKQVDKSKYVAPYK